jgi:hypothetical protein
MSLICTLLCQPLSQIILIQHLNPLVKSSILGISMMGIANERISDWNENSCDQQEFTQSHFVSKLYGYD